ncbi:CHASE3 domain-containing protein [Methylobacterium sp. A54F]
MPLDPPSIPVPATGFPATAATTRRGLTPLVVGFLLLIGIVAGTGGLVAMQRQGIADVRRSVELRGGVTSLFSAVQDAETGQRGYLLTDSETYLQPYEEALGRIERGLHTIADAVADDPDRTAEVTALGAAIEAKLDELRRTIALKRTGDSEGARELVRAGEGKRLMDLVRERATTLRAEISRALRERQERAARMATRVQLAVAAAALLTLALGAYTIRQARGRNRRLAAANETLAATHQALLDTVAGRERLEERLRQSQKMEALGQLTGGLAHDFNNMLAIITGNLSLIERALARGDAKVERYLAQALDGAGRAAALTHRLLAFARNQPLNPEPIDCNRLVPNLSEILRRTLGETIRVETVLSGGLWTARIDANQLENALLNLAVNARDAMPEGGRLTIETANTHLDDDYAAEHDGVPAGQYVMLALTDTGAGMRPEIAARAFDPFFTTKAPGSGTGLGLSQVYGFVRQSGGHVKIYSEVGQGTTVKLYLPRHRGEPAPADAPAGAGAALPQGRPEEVILVVEDDDGVRVMAASALADLGYTVLQASGAAAGLAAIEAHPEIALLFTDVVMPERSGRDLADAARRLRPGLRVLYTTGYTRNAIVHNGIVDAEVQLIGKPYGVERLARKVRQVLDAPA